jgi:hypothetical protein
VKITAIGVASGVTVRTVCPGRRSVRGFTAVPATGCMRLSWKNNPFLGWNTYFKEDTWNTYIKTYSSLFSVPASRSQTRIQVRFSQK